jgi:hypothetical protein
MIDPLLYMGLETDDWHLDINLINGDIEMLPIPREETTNQQRKAVLAYQGINTIPGDWTRGVNWGNIINNPQMSMSSAMVQVNQALDADEGTSADGAFTIPILSPSKDGLDIQLLTVSMDDLSNINLGA